MAVGATARFWSGIPGPQPVVLAVGLVVLYGFAHTDFQDFAALSAHPFTALSDPGRQFLHSSPLTFFLGWPITRLVGHNLSYALVTLGGFAALAGGLASALQPLPSGARRVAGLALLLSPLPLALLSWVGKSDPYVLACYVAYARLRGENPATAILSLLMVLGHKEIGTVILLGDAVLRGRPPIAAVVGFVAGQFLVEAYEAMLDTPIQSRLALGMAFLRPAIEGWAADPVTHVAFTFGWFWLLVLRRLGDPDRLRVAAVVVLCFAASFTASDFTRVFALCSAPVLLDTAFRLAGDRKGAALVATWPIAALSLVQAQVVAFNQVRDSHWPGMALDALRRAGWF